MAAQRITLADLPPPERCNATSPLAGLSVFSGATVDSDEVPTPDFCPLDSLELVSTGLDLDNIDFGPMFDHEDDHETPRARQGQFANVPDAKFADSPSKPKPFARVVGKAKGLVKALIHRKPLRKLLDRDPAVYIPESASAMAMSSAVPGGWREGRKLERLSVFMQRETMKDEIEGMPSRRVVSHGSNRGIYTPDHPSSPTSSFASLLRARWAEADTFPSGDDDDDDDVTAHSPHVEAPKLLPTLARIALFVPWCVTVGGTMLLFPKHLERVIFSLGYFSTPSPRDLRRFAFLSEMADDYVMIFVTTVISLCCIDFRLGMLAAAAVFCRFVLAWRNFEPRTCCLHERLGHDDMETLWLVAQGQVAVENVVTLRGHLPCPHAEPVPVPPSNN